MRLYIPLNASTAEDLGWNHFKGQNAAMNLGFDVSDFGQLPRAFTNHLRV
jgi:hypothetical protein